MSDNEQLSPEEKLLKVIQDPEGAGEKAEGGDLRPEVEAGEKQTAESGKQRIEKVQESPTPAAAAPAKPAAPVAQVEEVKKVEKVKEVPKPAAATPASAPDNSTTQQPNNSQQPAAVEEPAAKEKKSKLKLGKKAKGEKLKADSGKLTEEASLNNLATQQPDNLAPDTALIGGDGPVVADKKQSSRGFGISIINRSLAAIILILFLFSGFEIWGNIRKIDDDLLKGIHYIDISIADNADGGDAGSEVTGLVDIANILKEFGKRRMFGFSVKEDSGSDSDQDQGRRPPSTNWQRYVEQNYKLMGMTAGSDGEAEGIVVDGTTQRMLLLQVGQSVVVEGQSIQIKSIGADFLQVTDGKIVATVN